MERERERERERAARWLVAFSLLLLVVLVGWLWYGVAHAEPGPDIDITIGGGNAIVYQKSQVTITASNSAYKLDPAFFLELPILRLVRTSTSQMWNVGQYEVHFTDGRSFEAVKNPITDQVVWTCYDASGIPTVVTQGVAADGVPECMRGTVDSNLIQASQGGVSLIGNWVHKETDQP